jgi:enoyl-CoA hydratase
MPDAVLRVERDGAVATLTLDRPDKLNALNAALREALVAAFADVQADASIGVVILTGAGRGFCAGLDLRELGGEAGEGRAGLRAASSLDVIGAMNACDRPIIGAINGVAVTGGFELALACDVLLASRAARFADTHARVGILPGWGLSQKLSRAIGIYRAKELSLTGNYLDAETAERWGLVSRVVEPALLLPTARRLAADMLSCAPGLVPAYKRVIDQGFATTFAEGLRLEARESVAHAKGVTPEAVAKARAAVQSRGREQAR